ncbi:MAG TPA: phosphatase PAP2 family protein [Anaerolineales bacterium]
MQDSDSEKPVEKMKETVRQTGKAEIASPPTRRYRTLLFQTALISAIIAFATLTFLVETIPSFSVDLQITRAIQTIDSPLFAEVMRLVSWPGFLPQSIIITLLIAFVLYMYGLRWEAGASLLAAAVSAVTNELVKNLIQRPRPTADFVDVFSVLQSYSFPSGHVMFYIAFLGFVWYLAYTLLERSLLRGFLLGFFGSLVLLIGVSRIYLGHHWASDVVGAYLLGGLALMGIILFHQWGKKRFSVHQSVARHSERNKHV